MKNWLRLLRYVRPHWPDLGVVPVTMALSIGLNVRPPGPPKLLADQVLGPQPIPSQINQVLTALPGPHGREGLLFWVCVSTVLLFLAGTLIGMINTFASVGLNQRMTYDLGGDLFLHIQRLSLLFHTRREVGDTIARVTGDPYCVQAIVTGVLLPQIRAVVTLITMFAIMWNLNPTMTLLSLGVIPFLMHTVRIYGRPMKGRTRDRCDLEGCMMSVVQQALSAIPAGHGLDWGGTHPVRPLLHG